MEGPTSTLGMGRKKRRMPALRRWWSRPLQAGLVGVVGTVSCTASALAAPGGFFSRGVVSSPRMRRGSSGLWDGGVYWILLGVPLLFVGPSVRCRLLLDMLPHVHTMDKFARKTPPSTCKTLPRQSTYGTDACNHPACKGWDDPSSIITDGHGNICSTQSQLGVTESPEIMFGSKDAPPPLPT